MSHTNQTNNNSDEEKYTPSEEDKKNVTAWTAERNAKADEIYDLATKIAWDTPDEKKSAREAALKLLAMCYNTEHQRDMFNYKTADGKANESKIETVVGQLRACADKHMGYNYCWEFGEDMINFLDCGETQLDEVESEPETDEDDDGLIL